VDPALLEAARAAVGFMPEDEGLALYEAAARSTGAGPMLEIGSYCGKSAIYLGAAARASGATLFSVDHHRGSEEHQVGEEFHDERFLDEQGRVDTLGEFRRTIAGAGLDDVVIGVVGLSSAVAAWWRTPLGLLFIDGGHSMGAALDDYKSWSPWVVAGGLLVIHDVFEDPTEGGRPPFEIYRRALDSEVFVETSATGSLRVLQRVGKGL
jgi:predicted O-methyltransferase YrrM